MSLTNPNHPPKTAFLPKRWMEKELLDCPMNGSLANQAKVKLVQKRTPHGPNILTVSKKIIMVFLCLLTKDTTERPNKQGFPSNKAIHSVHTTKQNLPNKKSNFLRKLNPTNHIKTNSLVGEGSNNKENKDLLEKP